jgi:amino acid permease
MGPPFWAIPIGIAFILMAIFAIRRQRGRVFYALTGIAGLVSGLVWLDWILAYSGYRRPFPAEDIRLSEATRVMLSFDEPGHAPSTVMACLFCGAAFFFCAKAVLGSRRKPNDPPATGNR